MAQSQPLAAEAGAPLPARAGHPPGLFVLFGAEMWERLSYYGMRALLVLYLVKYLKWDEPSALDLYATYTGLVYLTPVLGGILADQFLGQRKAILVGGIVMALGHFFMAFESLLYPALGLIILGNGFFKPNISTMVGQLYPQGDPRRDSGYTIFYMGINIGAFLAPLVCGTLGERVGWHYGFSAAGFGMVLGLLNFMAFQRHLGAAGATPDGRTRIGPIDWLHVGLVSAACVGAVYAALGPAGAINALVPSGGWILVLGYWFLLASGLALLTWLVTKLGASPKPVVTVRPDSEIAGAAEVAKEDNNRPFTSVDFQRLIVILVVSAFSIPFWMGFEQAGGTLTLFADQRTDRSVFGYEFPASWFQSVNPLLIAVLALVFSMVWAALDRTRFRMNSAAKMGFGLVLLGGGFTIMFEADRLAGATGTVGPLWLVGVYTMNSIGEIFLSPIGLSTVNKLAHPRIASLMMALWFTCTAIANFLAGKLQSILDQPSVHQFLEGYSINLWAFLVISSIIPGLALIAISPLMKKMSHGRL